MTGMVPEGSPNGAGSVTRRAPFSANPNVGPRGQRTQQRIFDAAFQVLRDEGYQKFSVDRIARLAGCSRIAFYQYFSGGEEVLGHLGDEVTRQVSDSLDALGALTADLTGWEELRAWVGRQADIYQRQEPVFRALDAAAGSAPEITAARGQAGGRISATLRSRLPAPLQDSTELDGTISLLLGCLTRTFPIAAMLESRAPEAYRRDQVHDALTDVVHRTLFGICRDVNVHRGDGVEPPRLEFGPFTRELLQQQEAMLSLSDTASSTVKTLLRAGRTVLVQRGYHGTRVDDIVTAAGMSHGVFYRYFKNKNDFIRALVLQATRPLADALGAIDAVDPTVDTAPAELRAWLQKYNATQVAEAGLIRVWAEATAHDPLLGAAAAPALDQGRRQLAAFLGRRDFGNPQLEAVVMLAVLEAFGDRRRSPEALEAAARLIERGLLGH